MKWSDEGAPTSSAGLAQSQLRASLCLLDAAASEKQYIYQQEDTDSLLAIPPIDRTHLDISVSENVTDKDSCEPKRSM